MSKDTLTRRDFLRISGLSLTGLTLSSGPFTLLEDRLIGSAFAGEEPAVKIGYIPITDATPLLIAYAKGFFEEEGLRVEKPVLIRGWSAISEAFIAKKFNLVHLLFPIPIYLRYRLGVPVKVVAWDHTNNSAITVVDNGTINELPDLAGKRIAVPYWYSMHNLLLQQILRSFSIEPVIEKGTGKPGRDRTKLIIMNPPDMPPALASGSIDGYIVAEPFNAAGEIFAGGKILRFTGDVWKNHPCCVVTMHEESLVNRAWSQKVVSAVVKAQLFSSRNLAEVARILSKEGKNLIPLPERVLKRALTTYFDEVAYRGGAIRHAQWKTGRVGFQPYPFPSHTKKMIELFKKARLEGDRSFLDDLSGEHVASDLVSYEFVKGAVELVGGLEQFMPREDFVVSKKFGYDQEVTFEV